MPAPSVFPSHFPKAPPDPLLADAQGVGQILHVMQEQRGTVGRQRCYRASLTSS